MYAFLKFLMRLVTRTYLVGGLFTVEGAENVPRTGPLLVCPNHVSTIDPPMVPAFLPRPDSWSMGKAEYFTRTFTRLIFTRYHAFPVVRHTADRKAVRRARAILESGHVLVVYPEGTRIREGGLRQAEPGAGFLAQVTGAPVLPVGLIGTRDCFPTGAKWPRRRRVRVVFGRPFQIPARRPDGSRMTRKEASDSIMRAIAELLPPDYRGVYSQLTG